MVKNSVSGHETATAGKANSKYLYRGGLIIISLVYILVYSKVFDYKPDMNGDNIYYYSLGKALAEGKGYVNTMGFDETPHSHYPPGYPFIVSLLMRVGLGMTGIKIFNGLLLYLSCLIIYKLCFRISGNVYITFAATLLTACNSHLLRLASIMMSEIPFLFFSSLTLLLFLLMHDRKKAGVRYWLLAGVCVCTVTAYYVRTIGVTLWLAFLCTLITLIIINIRKDRKEAWRVHLQNNKLRLIAFACIAVFFMAGKTPWDMRNRQLGISSSYIGSLTTQLGGTKISDFGGWVERVKLNTVRYVTKEIPCGLFCKQVVSYGEAAKTMDWIVGLFIIAMLIVGIFRLRGVNLLVFYYIGGTAAVLMMWPDIWFSPRFMSPVIPLLLLLFLTGVVHTASKLLSMRKIKTEALAPLVSFALILCLYFGYSSSISVEIQKAKLKDYTRSNVSLSLAEYLEAAKWVKVNTPNDSRVSVRKPELFYIYSDGRKSIMFPHYATPEEIMTFFDRNKVDYVILDWWFRHAYATVLPAIQQNEDRFKVVHKIGGAGDVPATYVMKVLR
jgi:hypothetical protein